MYRLKNQIKSQLNNQLNNELSSTSKTLAIILAAGQGKRMNSNISKQYLEVFDKPIIVYTLSRFLENPLIDHVMIVVSEENVHYMKTQIIHNYFSDYVDKITVVVGGKERYDSVYSALTSSSESFDKILIHDGARPLVTESVITKVVHELDKVDACIVGVKAKDTFKLVDESGMIKETVNRDKLYTIQTPQGFHRNTIIEAYSVGIEKAGFFGVTDDSMMVELFSKSSVKIIEGEYTNIKITTPEDLLMMEKILLAEN